MVRRRARQEGLQAWALAALALVGPGCQRAAEVPAPTTAAPAPTPAELQVRDDMGRDVRLAAPARRVASLSPALTEILFAVGCGPALVLRDHWSDAPAEAKAAPEVDSLAPSVELILAARPDLVLTSFPPARLRGALDDAGIAWLGLSPARVDAIALDIARVGALCGAGERALKVRNAFVQQVAAVDRALVARGEPRVYLELDHASGKGWTAGDDTFLGDLIRRAHGVNAFGDQRGWPQISSESILAADPDIVLLAWPGSAAPAGGSEAERAIAAFAARPGLAALRAVRLGRVHRIDASLLGRPGPRVVEALRTLASLLHPDAALGPARALAPLPSAAP